MEEPLDPPTDEAPKNLLQRVRAWAAGGGKRSAIITGVLTATMIGTVATWLLVADYAAMPEEVTLEKALAALDAGDDEAARLLVARLQDDSPDGEDYSGQLFLLGALKVRQAEAQWSPERARTEYYIASRYLSEARTVGFPEDREGLGLYLLGMSLVESRQYDSGVETILSAMAVGKTGEAKAHLLLARAYRSMPAAKHRLAVDELTAALTDNTITNEDRGLAVGMMADSLAKIGRFDEAAQYVALSTDLNPPGETELLRGKVLVAELESLVGPIDSSATPTAPSAQVRTLASQAIAALEKARRLDKLATDVTRQSDYLLGRAYELSGDEAQARDRYAELRRKHGSSPSGIAASLAEGDILRRAGDPSGLEAYRRALDAVREPVSYEGVLLSLDEVRQRLREAHQGYLSDGAYRPAITLADRLTPPLPRTEQLALRAETLRRWGDARLAEAERLAPRGRDARREGRRRLREAGVAYEQLAEARFATRAFIDDLWQASEAYADGQSYSDTARVLERYLRNEPLIRNASALLKVGQSHLSLGEARQAITAFEECLTFHSTDVAAYQARLDCAHAYLEVNNLERAIKLLNENLYDTAMTPLSPEWRDSKFALGRLLVELGRHTEAIDCLTEAIDRYPDDPQALTARYLMAESHRHASEEPLERLADAKTVNEIERARAEADQHLQRALELYKSVQDEITLATEADDLGRATLRNCYMMRGSVLFEMGRWEEAIEAYSNVTTLYQNDPFSLVTLVQISHCRRRLQDNVRARGAIEQARLLLARLPADADFATPTNLTRPEWQRLLDELVLF
ncbi:MAG: tetratricopeptide repeat protein [Planctomycetota bacterium]